MSTAIEILALFVAPHFLGQRKLSRDTRNHNWGFRERLPPQDVILKVLQISKEFRVNVFFCICIVSLQLLNLLDHVELLNGLSF